MVHIDASMNKMMGFEPNKETALRSYNI